MNKKRFCSALTLLVAIVITSPLQALAPTSRTMQVSIGVLSTREDPVNLANLGEDFHKLHLAAGGIFTINFLSKNNLSMALDSEVWATAGQDLVTAPILLGARALIFPASPVRLYGTGGAGVCIEERTVSELKTWPFPPISYYESRKEVELSFAYAVGGGIEFVGPMRRRLFSIDYRYLVAGSDGSLGGHLLCVSYGFLF